jgi:hypothetical protein
MLLLAVTCAWLTGHGVAGGQCGIALCFALDESSSMRYEDFARSTQFIKDVIGNISQVSSEWAATALVVT